MVAAQLLLQSPEEDAFWTFISLMDAHLRPYFSNSSVQLEVDASLFGRAVEANDAACAKKLFGEMDIAPIAVCHALCVSISLVLLSSLLTTLDRFTTVFADALPAQFLVRLWDVFLFEGVHIPPVALARIDQSCRCTLPVQSWLGAVLVQ